MTDSNPPSRAAFDKLEKYVELMARYGPDSVEAQRFREENQHIDGFEEHAKIQYLLEKEDFEARRARSGNA